MRKNELFIVLIRAHTGLGKFARLFTGYPYTHIAVSLDRSLTDFVSYSRRYHSFPFDAGFTHEYRDYYAFGHHRDVKVKVYRLCPDDAHAEAVRKFLARCESDPDEVFNLYAMMTMPLLHGLRIRNAHNCMSFTAKVIELTGCVQLDKPYYRYSIPELDACLTGQPSFEGSLPRIRSAGYQTYMQRFEPVRYLRDLRRLTKTLNARLLRKQDAADFRDET